MEDFKDFGIDIPYRRTQGNVKCVCPNCKDKRTHPNDRSLSVNLEKGVWHCHYCQWSGSLNNYTGKTFKTTKVYAKPEDVECSNYSSKMLAYLASRCISEAVAKRYGVSEGVELMPPAKDSNSQEWRKINTIQFKYYLEGELINIKYRTGDKMFRLYKDAELIPYNIDSAKEQDSVIITEGEFDCLSFLEIGCKSVVSVPNGASNNTAYFDDFIEGWFDDKETIYIAVDTDTKGVEFRQDLISRFGAERCKIVTYRDCKDANEHLVKYGKDSLKRCLQNAVDVPIEGVYTIRDYEDELNTLFEAGMPKGVTIGFPNFDELVSFETRRVCIVTGVPTSGKSEFVDELCVRLLLVHGWRATFFSPENYPMSYHAGKWIPKITGKKFDTTHTSKHDYERAKAFLSDNFSHIMPKKGNTLQNVLEAAKMQVRRKGVKVVVLDPLNRLESDYGNLNETQFISNLLDELTSFAQKNNVLVILVAHPKKIQDEQGKIREPHEYDIKGSSTFYDKADYLMAVHRSVDKENEVKNFTKVKVMKVKFRHLGDKGACYFKFMASNGRYVPYDPDSPSGLFWDDRNYMDFSPVDKPVRNENDELLKDIKELEKTLEEIPF